ncbi:TetR/AcrR family transcriptional regulator [Deinococcus sp. Arct2-2]|uniref:TetR/AcrR family transcriptional regulator n=1 Tax=Deinococcus sp. Arct2-2 TaxID=2568653 RepID=UPI001454BF47|nr:TetR/AcrR family transcriptional regulator [Deinococcus sp. Arct2-2]
MTAERPLETITIRMLTDRAQVGYATFYRHYASIEDLLRGIVDDLYINLAELLPSLAGAQPERAATLVFHQVREHPGHYRLLLHADRSLGLLDKVVEMGTQALLAAYEARPDSRVPLDVTVDHCIRSFLNLIAWWLSHDMPYAPERMGQIFLDLVLHPMEAMALRPRISLD